MGNGLLKGGEEIGDEVELKHQNVLFRWLNISGCSYSAETRFCPAGSIEVNSIQ